MSLGSVLSTAVSGLRTHQQALELTSHNIANAQTPGYSRQVAEREAIVTANVGTGVRMAGIERQVDQLLARDVRLQQAGLGQAEVELRYAERIETLFGSPSDDSSISARLSNLTTALDAASANPGDLTLQRKVVDAAQAITGDLNALSRSIQSLRATADSEISDAVGSINAALERVADLNDDIVRGQVSGLGTSDLEDARDRALAEISKHMEISTFERANGEVAVFLPDGQPLLDKTPRLLAHNPAGSVQPGEAMPELTFADTGKAVTLRSGSLKGLLDARDTQLPAVQQQIDQLAVGLRDTLNQIHNRGTSYPAPQSLTGTRSFTDPDATRVTLTEPVRVAVTDASGTAVAIVDLPAGSRTLSALAAEISAGLGGTGTATVGNGTGLSISAANSGQGIAITDLGSKVDVTMVIEEGGSTRQFAGFSNTFGLNDLFATPGAAANGIGAAAVLRLNESVASDPTRLAAGQLSRNTDLAAGDVALSSGNAGTLAALSEALDGTRSFTRAGGLPAMQTSINDYAGRIVGDAASRVAGAESRQAFQDALVQDLSLKAQSISGVSIDEEMANLITLQNAYSASARVVTVVSEMLDTLMNLR